MVFNEKSKLFQPFILIGMLPVIILMSSLFLDALKKNDLSGLIITVLAISVVLGVIFILLIIHLDLFIDSLGLTFSFFPFKKTVTYKWNQIKSAEVIEFDPISEFGGWGRKKSRKFGVGYLTKGKYGLYVVDDQNNHFVLTVLDPTKVNTIVKSYLNIAS